METIYVDLVIYMPASCIFHICITKMVIWIEECERTMMLHWTKRKQDISGPVIAKMCKNRKVAYTVGYLLIFNLLPYEQYSDF